MEDQFCVGQRNYVHMRLTCEAPLWWMATFQSTEFTRERIWKKASLLFLNYFKRIGLAVDVQSSENDFQDLVLPFYLNRAGTLVSATLGSG